MLILKYYPVLLYGISFVVMLCIAGRIDNTKQQRNKERERYINSINRINSLMNAEKDIDIEAEVVDLLEQDDIVYNGWK